MMRARIVILVVVFVTCRYAEPTLAGGISLQNPYRSYNLSGVNYGSQQWERDHAKPKVQAQPAQTPRLFQRHHRMRRR